MGRATGAKAQARGPFLWRAVKGVGFPRRRFPLEEGVPAAVEDGWALLPPLSGGEPREPDPAHRGRGVGRSS